MATQVLQHERRDVHPGHLGTDVPGVQGDPAGARRRSIGELAHPHRDPLEVTLPEHALEPALVREQVLEEQRGEDPAEENPSRSRLSPAPSPLTTSSRETPWRFIATMMFRALSVRSVVGFRSGLPSALRTASCPATARLTDSASSASPVTTFNRGLERVKPSRDRTKAVTCARTRALESPGAAPRRRSLQG